MALIALLILIAAVLIIAGTIVYMLWAVCKKVLPPPNNGGTNNITPVFTYDNVTSLYNDQPITLPNLQFPELPKPPGWTEANPFGLATMELQRSTNLIDWETICVSTNPGQVLSMDDDTNPPPDRAFYRGRFVIPQ